MLLFEIDNDIHGIPALTCRVEIFRHLPQYGMALFVKAEDAPRPMFPEGQWGFPVQQVVDIIVLPPRQALRSAGGGGGGGGGNIQLLLIAAV